MATRKRLRIHNLTRPLLRPLIVASCDDFRCRFLGLMGQRSLGQEEGLLFRWPKAGRVDTAIHMLFMRFPIAIIWLDTEGKVVDRRHARPWVDFLIPSAAAQYVLEIHPDRLDEFATGDQIQWHET